MLGKVITLLLVIIMTLGGAGIATANQETKKDALVDVSVEFLSPPQPNTPFTILIFFKTKDTPVVVKDPFVTFTMKMPMGKFEFTPTFDKNKNSYTIDNVTLPKCMSGSKDWSINLSYDFENGQYKTVIPFKLQ